MTGAFSMRVLALWPSLESASSLRQAHLLQQSGLAVRICTWEGSRGKPYGPCISSHEPSRGLDVRPGIELHREVKAFQPDVVHVFRPREHHWSTWLALHGQRVPVVVSADEPVRPLFHWQRWLAGGVARWVVPTAEDAWPRALAVPRQQCEMIAPPGLVAEPNRAQRAELRTRLRLPREARVIVCADRLERIKGFKEAIWTLDILRHLHPDLYLVIAGAGPELDRLARFARDVNLTPFVRFVGGAGRPEDWLALADVAWFPSLAGDFPELLVEAMGHGLPVVGTRVAGLAGILEHEVNGLLAQPGDKPDLARQTNRVLDEPALARKLALAARATIERRHAPAQWQRKVVELYQNVAGRREPKGGELLAA